MTWFMGGGVLGGDSSASLSIATYSATGNELSITGIGFQPDLVWIKDRQSIFFSHHLTDSERGATNGLSSDTTAGTVTNAQRLKSFDADGFTVGTDEEVNSNTYVAWCFRKNQQVFDIVSYTGTGVARTVDHNMSVAPELIIVKDLDDTQDWVVYHAALDGGTAPEDYYLRLNTTDHEQDASSVWNDTAPTGTQFTVGNGSQVNSSGRDYIAYLFTSREGVSKVGSYSGTGVAGNAITGLGFSPKFVMIKRRDATANWVIYDAERGDNLRLYPDQTDPEGTNDFSLDSDGFTCNDSGGNTNASGTNNYIYLAMA